MNTLRPRRPARRRAGQLPAAAAVLLAIVAGEARGQDGWPFAPRSARISDAVIARDLATFDTLARRAVDARAGLYVALAREAYERNDDGRLSAALLETARTGGAASARVRPDLWQTLEAGRGTRAITSATLDSLEVALVRAAHPLLGAPSCARWEQRADSLAGTVRAQLASLRDARAVERRPTEPVAAPPAIRRPGPLPDRVHFALDRAALSPQSEAVLQAVADSLRDAGSVTIELEGHTDRRASDAYNDALSARRAEAVRDWLVAHGVAADRITVRALGRAQLLVAGSSAEAHARNRRVRMRFIASDGTVLVTLEQRDDLQPERR